MCALTCNRYKRHVDSQFHSSKKLKPVDSGSIAREIQAPCIVITGFPSTAVKRSATNTMEDLLSKYNRTKEVAKGFGCKLMDSRRKMSIEDDRLSVLPDDLILKILSFLSSKQVIGTSILSNMWRHVWTSIPHLNLSSQDISTDFVTYVLSRRNNRVQLSSINLYLRLKDDQINVDEKIMNQAFSLGVQQLNLRCLFGKVTCVFDKYIEPLSLSLSSSQILKHLTLSTPCCYNHITLMPARELLSLTTLHLDSITLYDGFFSMCPNLEILTLIGCSMIGSNVLRICHPRLSNLTLNSGDFATLTTNVVTPQLKSLTIIDFCGNYLISAPELASLLC